MFAIVESSGRQYQLEAGRFVDIDSTSANPGDEFVFDRVLMLVNGKESTVGAPLIEGARVIATVLEHGRQRKIIVYHQKPKKGTRKKQGHRQGYTRMLVQSIHLKEEVLAKAEAKKKLESRGQSGPDSSVQAGQAARAKSKPSKKDSAEAAPKQQSKASAKPEKKADKKPDAKPAKNDSGKK
jgi:large subunit ribosomal protein L21